MGPRMPAARRHHADVASAQLFRPLGSNLFLSTNQSQSNELRQRRWQLVRQWRPGLSFDLQTNTQTCKPHGARCQKNKKRLSFEQRTLVSKLRDGSLLAEANRLIIISGNGRFKRPDGTFIDIGGSTGGFTRTVLYDWAPPNLDDEFQ